jgi:ABC-type multidrug transport system fused ATPase/permease subunit
VEEVLLGGKLIPANISIKFFDLIMPSYNYTSINCYKVLEIPWNAGPNVIRQAFFRKSKQSHPDLGGSHEMQIKVNSAYEILSDPITRESHDRYWKNSFEQVYSNQTTGTQTEGKNHSINSFDKLYKRITDIFTNNVENIRKKHHAWVREKSTTYKQQYENWHSKMQSDFENDVENYEKILVDKLENQNFYYWGTIIISIVTMIASIILLSIINSTTFIFLLVVLTLCGLVWALYKNNKNIWVHGSIFSITDPEIGTKINKALLYNLNSKSFKVGNTTITFQNGNYKENIDDCVEAEWTNYFQKEEKEILANKNYYMSMVAQICDIAGRSTTFDSSEEQAARRIATTFFFMGYIPIKYIDQARMFIMSDGLDNIAIRFRHRRGAPTNISYVRRMVEEMSAIKAYKGFLFCTPGLTDNARIFAKQHNITWYSLESMNRWIENVNLGSYDGPSGDIFKLLTNMVAFLRHISIALPR